MPSIGVTFDTARNQQKRYSLIQRRLSTGNPSMTTEINDANQITPLPHVPSNDAALGQSNGALPEQAAVSPAPTAPVQYVLSFTGTGGEYFKIWIVNLLLMMITLGIYYPWAKVRKAKYLHRNMMLDGAAFDYHAEGGVLLKGTIIAGVLYGAYHLIEGSGSGLAFTLFTVTMCVLLPWLLWKSFRFKLSVTSYRALPRMGYLYRLFCTTRRFWRFSLCSSPTVLQRIRPRR
jgi:Bacterial protein of unknown function (DUF898)